MKVGDKVKVIGGNNEIGQPTMIGKIGTISSFGTRYTVKGRPTKEVYVNFPVMDYNDLHVFNNYHLEPLKTTHNSDYTVTASFTPKLPSLDDVEKQLQITDKMSYGFISTIYETIKKLGNFA